MPNGEVLIFEYVEGKAGIDRTSRARTWDYRTGVTTDVSIPYNRDLFCASNNVLPDGRVYVAGGHDTSAGKKQDAVGVANTDVYDPATRQWTPGPNMGQARWYPTNVQLPDGRTLTFGGHASTGNPSTTVDAFDPVANTVTPLPAGATKSVGLYPRMHLLPDGRIVKTGPAALSSYFNPQTNIWSNGPKMKFGQRQRGLSILLPGLSRVIQIGGQGGSSGTATNTAEILDLSLPTPAWRYTAPMNNARILANGVLLPDGKLFVNGGGVTFKYTGPVRAAEMFDPVTETWSVMASQQASRMYHATSLLLPDGRVLSAGQDNGVHATMGEIYSPPYLFRGPRPTISGAPGQVGYGSVLTITSPEAADITSATLIRAGSLTHQIDSGQRYVGLPFTVAGETITATGPANGAVAPPGDYMLFLVNSQGVPSEASWVHVGS